MGFLDSDVKIANMALTRLGEETITAFTETSEAATVMNLLYPIVRDEEIQAHPWTFAKERATLTRDSSTPSFEWTYQYLLPSDFLQADSIYNSAGDGTFAIEGDKLLTDEETVYFKYMKRVTVTTQFNPYFVKALYLKLAMAAAPRITALRGRKIDLDAEYNKTIHEAKRLNAIADNLPERPGNKIDNYVWVTR
jgi:hypothetical protein